MKTKSRYLEIKGYTINEFRNKIVYELKERNMYKYGLKTRVSKYHLRLSYNEKKLIIPYRALEKGNIKNIIEFYIDDIKEMFE